MNIHYRPNYNPKKGDDIVAERTDSWGTVTEMAPIDEDEDVILVTIGERLDVPRGKDTFKAIVNGEETEVHIDFITDVIAAADALRLKRGTLSELKELREMFYEDHIKAKHQSGIVEDE